MASRTDVFFDDLGRRGHEPALRNRTATVRFDVVRGKVTDRWIVAIRAGDIAVTRGDDAADCVLRGDQTLFDALISGETNPMAAMLRGALLTEGDVELLVAARRLMQPSAEAHPNGTEARQPMPSGAIQPMTSGAGRKS